MNIFKKCVRTQQLWTPPPPPVYEMRTHRPRPHPHSPLRAHVLYGFPLNSPQFNLTLCNTSYNLYSTINIMTTDSNSLICFPIRQHKRKMAANRHFVRISSLTPQVGLKEES